MAKAARSHRTQFADEKYLGPEPDLSEGCTQIELVRAYNWYNYFYSSDDAKGFVITYLKSQKANKDIIRRIGRVDANKLVNAGWSCRILTNGGKLPNEITEPLFQKIKTLSDSVVEKVEVVTEEIVKPVVSIQERINNKASELIGDLEGEVDTFYTEKKSKFDPEKWLREKNVSPQISQKIVDFYKPLYAEIYDAIAGKDHQLVEAYSHWKKPHLKAYLEFVRNIVASAEARITIVKAIRKPRKKKEKPAAVVVGKLNYKKEDTDLGLTSIKATDVLGSQQLWVYNTKTRNLTVYNAMSHSGIGVKGSTLTGFDEKLSVTKKLRKPAETLKQVQTTGKVALRKLMDSIKTKSGKTTGRINSDVILLRNIK